MQIQTKQTDEMIQFNAWFLNESFSNSALSGEKMRSWENISNKTETSSNEIARTERFEDFFFI